MGQNQKLVGRLSSKWTQEHEFQDDCCLTMEEMDFIICQISFQDSAEYKLLGAIEWPNYKLDFK